MADDEEPHRPVWTAQRQTLTELAADQYADEEIEPAEYHLVEMSNIRSKTPTEFQEWYDSKSVQDA